LTVKYGLEGLPYHDFDLETMARHVAGHGVTYVNLWASPPPLASHVDVWKDEPAKVSATLDRFGLKPSGLSMYGRTKDDLIQCIKFAGEIGAPPVIFDCEASYGEFVSETLPELLAVAETVGVDLCIENHITVPFTSDFESGGHEEERWDEGVDTFAQIKRLITDIEHPNLKIALAPPHLWVENEPIAETLLYLLERKKLGYYYIWDIDRSYQRGKDGLNFGAGEQQLPRAGGTLDHHLLLNILESAQYDGYASVLLHGTGGWSLEYIDEKLAESSQYLELPARLQRAARAA
jgi:sugar phosphate isomerase/epimerase